MVKLNNYVLVPKKSTGINGILTFCKQKEVRITKCQTVYFRVSCTRCVTR